MTLELTEDVRKAIRDKRLSLGLSQADLANLLGIRRITLSRWENGPTNWCIHALTPVLQDFLAGKMDPPAPRINTQGKSISNQLQELIVLYAESYHTPKLQKQLLDNLQKIVDKYEVVCRGRKPAN